MKKAIFIICVSLILTVGIFFATQTIFGKANNTGELQITSQPESKVYLDGQYIGDTPICRCAGSHSGNVLPIKQYVVKLVPKQGDDSPFFENVTITKGVLTVVDYTFGAPGESSGSTLELTPAANAGESALLVTSFPSGANVLLDDNSIGNTPLSSANPTASDHTITLQKNGYEDKTLHINTPQGYTLQAIVYLAVNTQASTSVASPSGTTSVASASADLTPSPVVAKVTILDTPTGFLRVRADATLDSAEVEEVKPGDSLYLLSEQDGWYQVKLPDNKIGWVSAQYAQKNE